MGLFYESPRYLDEVIVLTGYDTDDVGAHLAGEDEETARRFGWWPKSSTPEGVLASFEEWAKDWQGDGPTRTFAVKQTLVGIEPCQARPSVASLRAAELTPTLA